MAEHDDDEDEDEDGAYGGARRHRPSDDGANADEGDDGGDDAVTFPYVILDEAGAMLEPDSMGTLLHGARGCLLVGDHLQLPPFTALPDQAPAVRREGYAVSLLERLATRGGGGGGGGGGGVAMLREQYRMSETCARMISDVFYGSALRTPPAVAAARSHPAPCCFVGCATSRESRPKKGKGASFQNLGRTRVTTNVVSAA